MGWQPGDTGELAVWTKSEGRLLENPPLLGEGWSYVLLRCSADWRSPTRFREGNLLSSKSRDFMVISAKMPSQKHPKECLTKYLGPLWPKKLTHRSNHHGWVSGSQAPGSWLQSSGPSPSPGRSLFSPPPPKGEWSFSTTQVELWWNQLS